MTISRISTTKQGRFALFDEAGTFLFSVDDATLFQYHLKEGTAITADALFEVQSLSDTRKAKEKALGYLSMRDYASGELRQKLAQKFDPDTANTTVQSLIELDLIDDARFARHRAWYLANQNNSLREIRQKLAEKGVARDLIDDALDTLDTSQEDACYAVIAKQYLRKLAQGDTQKVLAALARRGFPYGIAKAALARFDTPLQDFENPDDWSTL